MPIFIRNKNMHIFFFFPFQPQHQFRSIHGILYVFPEKYQLFFIQFIANQNTHKTFIINFKTRFSKTFIFFAIQKNFKITMIKRTPSHFFRCYTIPVRCDIFHLIFNIPKPLINNFTYFIISSMCLRLNLSLSNKKVRNG